MSSKKKAAGNATSQAAKKNTTTKIIAVPLDVVNMSDKFKFPQNAIVNVEKMAWLRENSAIKK